MRKVFLSAVIGLLLSFGALASAMAAETSGSGAVGIEGRVSADPPKNAATITTPSNGSAVTEVPITISGLCSGDVLVKLYSNNVFIGSALCQNGSYRLQADLFNGQNQLIARVFDALDQAGPDSNAVTVNYVSAQFAEFGSQLVLTSLFARRGANPGTELAWPLQISGGRAPYAVSVAWGDGSNDSLRSLDTAGDFTVTHTYTNAGTYTVVVRVTDANGVSGFLQLVAVANGAVQSQVQTDGQSAETTADPAVVVVWWPVLAVLPLLFAAFWLGRRHQVTVLRKQIDIARRQ